VSVVRELFGVMAARGATGGFVVSIGPSRLTQKRSLMAEISSWWTPTTYCAFRRRNTRSRGRRPPHGGIAGARLSEVRSAHGSAHSETGRPSGTRIFGVWYLPAVSRHLDGKLSKRLISVSAWNLRSVLITDCGLRSKSGAFYKFKSPSRGMQNPNN
jgi:hypothetical protein